MYESICGRTCARKEGGYVNKMPSKRDKWEEWQMTSENKWVVRNDSQGVHLPCNEWDKDVRYICILIVCCPEKGGGTPGGKKNCERQGQVSKQLNCISTSLSILVVWCRPARRLEYAPRGHTIHLHEETVLDEKRVGTPHNPRAHMSQRKKRW